MAVMSLLLWGKVHDLPGSQTLTLMRLQRLKRRANETNWLPDNLFTLSAFDRWAKQDF